LKSINSYTMKSRSNKQVMNKSYSHVRHDTYSNDNSSCMRSYRRTKVFGGRKKTSTNLNKLCLNRPGSRKAIPLKNLRRSVDYSAGSNSIHLDKSDKISDSAHSKIKPIWDIHGRRVGGRVGCKAPKCRKAKKGEQNMSIGSHLLPKAQIMARKRLTKERKSS